MRKSIALTSIDEAIYALRNARSFLKQAGASKRCVDRVRAALKSAEGARRHAENQREDVCMMTLEEACNIKPGQKLRMLCDGCAMVYYNDGGEDLRTFKAGDIVTVDSVDFFASPQGRAITVTAANGVTNVFDEADYGGNYPFERI